MKQFYIYPIFHIFEKRVKNLKIPILFISFIDDGLFISQEKSFEKTNSHFFCSYSIISILHKQFGLVIKHGKTEVFTFLDHIVSLILILWTLATLGVLSFDLKIHEDILGLFLTESFFFSLTYQILFQQNFVICQVYEDAQKLHA